jgi:sugar lactone lactonase YvrE
VDLQTGRYTRIVQDLGEVRALCLNAGATHLFAADSARRRVWSVRLHPTPTAAVFAPNVGLREPTGLALDAAGNLWIADASPSAGAIYVVAPNGSLIRTLPR